MKPVVDGLKKRYGDKIEFQRLNVEDAEVQPLADQFGVQYVPTFVFINTDGSRSDQIVGGVSKQELERRLKALK